MQLWRAQPNINDDYVATGLERRAQKLHNRSFGLANSTDVTHVPRVSLEPVSAVSGMMRE
jgi:hypothetical protein